MHGSATSTDQPAPIGMAAAHHLMQERAASLDDLFVGPVAELHFQPGAVILLAGHEADTVYRVVSGTVRCCTFTEEGRRQIFGFSTKGDYLGFADLDVWHFSAEAVDHVVLSAIPRTRAEARVAGSPALQRALRELITGALAERENQLVALAYMPSEQRLHAFLLGFAARRRSTGFVVLPMTRRDIADHLGLSLETVSRSFSTLKARGLIEMRGSDRFRLPDQTDKAIQVAA